MVRALCVGLLVGSLSLVVGCDREEEQDVPDAFSELDDANGGDQDANGGDRDTGDVDAGEELPNYDVASGPLEVGFARVQAPWRVGAKPGQVGTNAYDGLEQTMSSALAGLIPIVTGNLEPEEMLDGATGWAMEMLENDTQDTEPGVYSILFHPGKGIEEPPDVKATVIQRGDLKVAVVGADIYLMHEYLHRRVADLVEEETGIGRDQIFLAGSHNHSAPQPSHPSPGVWTLADGFDPRHFVYITHKVAEAIIEADRNRKPARLRVRKTDFRDVQFNIIGPSTIEMASEEEDAEAEEITVGYPYEHFDGDLDLLYFDEADAPHDPIALVFAFGMHPETLPNNHGLTSGEFPVHVERHLQERLGFPAMWLPGPLGDIEPDRGRSNEDHVFWRESFGALHQMSPIIADAVEESLEALRADTEVEPEVEPFFRNISRDIPGTEDFPFPTSAYISGIRLKTPRVLHGSTLSRLHAIRLGDALLLGLPAEVTSDLSYNIKSRVNDEVSEVYQGYIFPDNPEWVADRVRANFSTDQLDPEVGAPVPIVTSMVNGYIGYVVTRWEYENREHYRMHMTSHGPETADHLATHLVGFVDEMMGGPRFEVHREDWIDADLEGVEELMGFFEGLDERVTEMQRELPITDADSVGEILTEPALVEAFDIDPRLAIHGAISFGWRGATADMTPPTITVERQNGESWEPLETGPSLAMHLFLTESDRWMVRWHPEYGFAQVDDSDTLRFRVDGVYRSDETGSSEVHPIWDPDGANKPYEVVSSSFELGELDW